MTKQYAYSPHTGERILTDTPADWMGVTAVAPPVFDSATTGCFWKSGAWVLVAPPEPAQEEIIADYEAALDSFLDSVALTYRYGVNWQIPPRYSLVVRTGFPNDDQQLAVAFGAWMDICNRIAKAKLNEVLAGHAVMPTKEEFIEMLPPFEAPV